MEKTKDLACQAMLALAQRQDLHTVWDRFAQQTPQCGFG